MSASTIAARSLPRPGPDQHGKAAGEQHIPGQVRAIGDRRERLLMRRELVRSEHAVAGDEEQQAAGEEPP
jgi:hypothetical protein